MAVVPSLLEWAEIALEVYGQKPAAHHRLLLAKLDAASCGEVERLMVLMPPGSAKSTYASVLFPAWWFAEHPRSAMIATSHTESLASHFGRRTRQLVQEHAGTLGYKLEPDERAAHRWRTSRGGEYFATGMRGPIAGRRADLAIIDDPVKSWAEADSPTAREHAWQWYRADLVPRLKPRGRIILVMTRWHQDDLGGRILDTEKNWTVVRLPALAEAEDPLGRQPGAALWPEWEDVAAIERRRSVIGDRTFSALYQQDPKPQSGGLFLVDRIAITEHAAEDSVAAVRAWDLAAAIPGPGRDPDWTVGLRLERDTEGNLLVTDVQRLRGSPGEVEAVILESAREDGADVLISLPQDPGQAGRAQVAYLTRRLAGFRVTATPETGSKITRASPVAAQVEAGNLRLLRGRWNLPFLDELRDFPHGNKDDQVDALSRAFMTLLPTDAPTRRLHIPHLGR
jgi:predicted phage terminase large subunit-like protein